jgi:hypothetical protein
MAIYQKKGNNMSYGAIVFKNGKRVEDRERTALYDEGFPDYTTWGDENSTKHHPLYSYHAVLGDGYVRVGCYKQNAPEIYNWDFVANEPSEIPYRNFLSLTEENEYSGTYDVSHSSDIGFSFRFVGKAVSVTGHFEAYFTEPDGTEWVAVYDSMFGDGTTDFYLHENRSRYPFAGKYDSYISATGHRFPRKLKKQIANDKRYKNGYETPALFLAWQQERAMLRNGRVFNPLEARLAKHLYAIAEKQQERKEKRRERRWRRDHQRLRVNQ